MRFLVTGATGFIGGRIAERLVLEENNNQVIALVRDFSRISKLSRFSVINFIKGDVLDLGNMIQSTKDCDIIFHCAYGNKGDEKFMRSVTVEGTRNICKAALKNDCRLVYLSTVSVYGDSPPNMVDEKTSFKQSNDIYTKSKIEAEKVVWGYIKKHSLAATIIRPTIVYGPYSPVWTNNPIRQLRKKELLLIDDGKGLCNHLYIDNLVDALFLAALSKKSIGQAYIISDGSAITWKEFFSFYQSMLNELGIENDLIFYKKEDLYNLIKTRKSLFYNLRGIIKALIANESLNLELYQYSLVRTVKGFIKQILPKKAEKAVRDFQNTNSRPQNDLDPPTQRDIRSFTSKSIYSIKKARSELGYNPKVDIIQGMNLIKQWYWTLF